MKKTVKVKIINLIVVNHIKESVEVVPFGTTDEAAEFSDFVMNVEKKVHEVFFGKSCEVEFDDAAQTIRLLNTTEDKVIVEIRVDVHDDVEVVIAE